MGFDAVFNGRTDFQEMHHKEKERSMEYVHYPNHGSSSIFTKNFVAKNYCSPISIADGPDSVNVFNVTNEYIMGDGLIDFITGELMPYTVTPGILFVPFGCDFSYSNATKVWTAIDNMMTWMKLFYPDFRLHLSTPSEYLEALNVY